MHATTINTVPMKNDEGSVKNIPVFLKVVRQGSFVGVVAKTEWAAMRAAQELKVSWAKPTSKIPTNSEELYDYLKNTKSFTTLKGAEKGNPATAFTQAKKQYEASFRDRKSV